MSKIKYRDLTDAVEDGKTDIKTLKLLIDNGIRGTKHTLYWAFKNGVKDIKTIELLIEAGSTTVENNIKVYYTLYIQYYIIYNIINNLKYLYFI